MRRLARGQVACAFFWFLVLTVWSSSAAAQGVGDPPADTDSYADACPNPLTRDWVSRADLKKNSQLTYCVNYTGEALGNVSGGIRPGGIYEGRLEVALDYRHKNQALWETGVHVSADQIHGRGLSTNYLGNNILTASGNEAERATRLFTLWLQEQKEDAISIRVGQLAADDEFAQSKNGSTFVNSTFGWPGILASDLPSNGPAYPLATPGVRVSLGPQDGFSLMAAVFNGDPAGRGSGTPQSRDAGGTAFRLNDGAFAIAEATLGRNQKDDDKGAPQAIKLGAWYNTERFADERFDTAGLSLANPLSSHLPAQHRGDYGGYIIVDLFFSPKVGRSPEGLGIFARVAASPSDRNLVSFYADGGLTWTGVRDTEGYQKDVVGLGLAYAGIGDGARALDRDARFFGGIGHPIRDHEASLELTYVCQMRGWAVQPDLQFIFHPGGHVPDPTDPTKQRAIRDAVVVGLRSMISF